MTSIDTTPAPVRSKDRMLVLDVLRGLAILGILAVNALVFAWPFAVMMTPEAATWADTAANATAQWVTHVFFENKMRTLFTLLFGVSIFLVGGEREDEDRSRVLKRRLFWLAVFGVIHGLAVWYGDILLQYAWAGLFVAMMRSMSARKLLAVGGGLTLLFAVLGAGAALLDGAASGQPSAGKPDWMQPATAADVMAAIEAYRSGWAGAMTENAQSWLFVQGASLLLFVLVTIPLMMFGLGLFKAGFLTGKAPTWVYGLVIALGGAVLAAHGTLLWSEAPAADAVGSFAPLVTLAYASILILMTTRGLSGITRILAPVGRMAFTNYLTQSLIMASLFYMPWGPVWFGQMGPAALWGVVVAIWALQLVWSPLWLSRFEMGPLEWAWRVLTYGRRVPFLKQA